MRARRREQAPSGRGLAFAPAAEVCWRGEKQRLAACRPGNVPAGALAVGRGLSCNALRSPRAPWGPARSASAKGSGPAGCGGRGGTSRGSLIFPDSRLFSGGRAPSSGVCDVPRAFSPSRVGGSWVPAAAPFRSGGKGRAGGLAAPGVCVPRRSQVCITRYNQSVRCCALVLTPRRLCSFLSPSAPALFSEPSSGL